MGAPLSDRWKQWFGRAARTGLLQIPGIAQTAAGRNKRVLQYEDQYLLGMGPRTGQALLDLVKALHPELR